MPAPFARERRRWVFVRLPARVSDCELGRRAGRCGTIQAIAEPGPAPREKTQQMSGRDHSKRPTIHRCQSQHLGFVVASLWLLGGALRLRACLSGHEAPLTIPRSRDDFFGKSGKGQALSLLRTVTEHDRPRSHLHRRQVNSRSSEGGAQQKEPGENRRHLSAPLPHGSSRSRPNFGTQSNEAMGMGRGANPPPPPALSTIRESDRSVSPWPPPRSLPRSLRRR